MVKFSYNDKKRREISFPLGGIGTGSIGLLSNGALGNFEINNNPCKNSRCCSFFAIKAEENGKTIDARIIQADNEFSGNDALKVLPCFSNCNFTSYFPFAELDFSCEDFPADVKMTSFNPFLPLCDTDSGIPAAFFEFEVCNTTSKTVDYTVCGVLENLLPNCRNKAGCSESGEAYIFMDSDASLTREKCGNMCISTDGKNVSYREHLSKADALTTFWNDFTINSTFVNSKSEDNLQDNTCGVLATHFTIEAGEKKSVRFIISWFFPYSYNYTCPLPKEKGETEEDYINKNTRRNYYAQYFESSLECACYCFKHRERLEKESLKFAELLLGSTLPEAVLECVSESLYLLKNSIFTRVEDGSFKDPDFANYALPYLFPHLERSTTAKQLKKVFEETQNEPLSDLPLYMMIISSYRNFRINGDEDELIENWYYISKALDYCIENDNFDGYDGLFAVALKSGYEMATVVKDKKRAEAYIELLGKVLNASSALTKNQLSAQFQAELLGFSEIFQGKDYYSSENTASDSDCQAATLMLMHGNVEKGLELIEESKDRYDGEEAKAYSSYALLGAMSGFEYDAYSKHIGFKPLSDYCPLEWGGTFKCFFCVEGGYGYVEEGIDYIEINMVYGKLDIRSFGVPRTPRLVQYGGRNWKFSDTGLCATLDTNLEVFPGKKLTILIDIKPQK